MRRKKRVERRTEPAGLDFGDDLVAGAALEPEDVRLAAALDAAVDDDRQGDRLRGLRGVVRLDFPAFGQRVHRVQNVVGDGFTASPCRLPDAGAAGLGIERQLPLRQVPAADRRHRGGSGLPAEREELRDERLLADGDAIDEVLAAAIDRVADFQLVFPVRRDREEEDRVGIEEVMVRAGQLPALGVVQGDHGLEPAGDGVGHVGNQVARLRLDDEALSAPRAEADPVHFSREGSARSRARATSAASRRRVPSGRIRGATRPGSTAGWSARRA